MKRIVTALILIPLVLLLVFKAPFIVVKLAVCGVALLALYEYLNIVEQYDYKPFRVVTFLSAIAIFLLPGRSGVAVLLVLPFVYLIVAMRRSNLREGLPAAALCLFGTLYIAFSLLLLADIRNPDTAVDGAFWLVVLFATVWTGDAVAMYAGKAFGRHKLALRISPNKTWEGSVGSVFGSLAFSLLAFHYYSGILRMDWSYRHSMYDGRLPSRPSLAIFIPLVIILNIAGQLGDLVESVIKRGANVKDSGSLLPGHGGVLDRIDALLFASPVLWYYLVIVRA